MFIATFVIYCLAVLFIGYRSGKKSTGTDEDIYLADRDHSHWTAALSAGAATESGFVLLGMVGMGYNLGANCFWIVPAGMLGYAINWLILGPAIRAKTGRLNAVSVPEFFKKVTQGQPGAKLARLFAALLSVAFMSTYTAAQFGAAGKAIGAEFSINYGAAVLIGSSVIVAYVMMGGFRAVSWTDNLQAIMMVGTLIIIPALAVSELGGFSAMIAKLRSIDPALVSPTGNASGIRAILMSILPWLMLGLAYPGQPHAVARLMATRQEAKFGIAAATGIVWFFFLYAGAILLGMAVRAGFAPSVSPADKELLLPAIASSVFTGVAGGLILASILAAISSTADSTLYSAASTITRDLWPNLNESRTRLALQGLIALIGIGAIAIAAMEVRAVFAFTLYSWTGLGASLGPAILYGALHRAPKAIALNAGLIVGGVLAFVLHSHPLNLLIAFGASLVAIMLTHLLTSTLPSGSPARPNANPSR